MATPERLCVGAIVGVFGVKGELKLRSYTDPIHGIARYRLHALGVNGGDIAYAVYGAPDLDSGEVLRISGERAHARRFNADVQAVG